MLTAVAPTSAAKDDDGGADEHAVAARELDDAVGGGGRTGGDRLVPEVALEVGGEGGGGWVAALGLLGERLGEDGLQVSGERPIDRPQRTRFVVLDGASHLGQRLAVEVVGQSSGQQLVAQHAERVDVGTHVDRVARAADLLGTGVGDRADVLSLARQGLRSQSLGVRQASDAEVEHLGRAALLDQHVAGLQVAVDDALAVCVLDGLADSDQEAQASVDVELLLLGPGRDRRAGDELHGEEGQLAPGRLGGPGLVDARDAGMRQPPEHLGLELETAQVSTRGEPGLDQLQRDVASRVLLLGLVDDAHAAAADLAQDAVGADAFGERAPVVQRVVGQESRGLVGGALEERVSRRVAGEHRLHLVEELHVSRALRFEERRAFVGVELGGRGGRDRRCVRSARRS